MQVYCTSFCNKSHRLHDGKPVEHQCYVLNPQALHLERAGGDLTRIGNARGQIFLHEGRIHGGVMAQ